MGNDFAAIAMLPPGTNPQTGIPNAGRPPRRGEAMTDQDHRHLARADQRIAECEEQIARQHKLIEQLLERGQETAWAKDMLEALQSSLRAFEAHRKRIVAQMDGER